MEYSLIRLTDRPELKAQAAAWFHAKWGVPEQAYLDSMDDALREAGPVPQWYLVLESSRIIGGMGVIENDFHDRKDLTPNVCAVYTEPDRRCRGGRRCTPYRYPYALHSGRHPSQRCRRRQ